jgi:hypothetical protein
LTIKPPQLEKKGGLSGRLPFSVAVKNLLVLVFFVFLVAVAPVPIVPLLSAFQPVVFTIGLVPLVQPATIGLILAIVPVVVVPVVAVVIPLSIPVAVIAVMMFVSFLA